MHGKRQFADKTPNLRAPPLRTSHSEKWIIERSGRRIVEEKEGSFPIELAGWLCNRENCANVMVYRERLIRCRWLSSCNFSRLLDIWNWSCELSDSWITTSSKGDHESAIKTARASSTDRSGYLRGASPNCNYAIFSNRIEITKYYTENILFNF